MVTPTWELGGAGLLVEVGPNHLRTADPNGKVGVYRGYSRFQSAQTFRPPYVWTGRAKCNSIMEPAIFADGTPCWYTPSIVWHAQYPSNDHNVLISFGKMKPFASGMVAPEKVGCSAEMRDEHPEKPYQSRSGYASRSFSNLPTGQPYDGQWHDFMIEVLSHAHYRMTWDGRVIADVVENEPPTILPGTWPIGLRLDFADVEFKDMQVTSDNTEEVSYGTYAPPCYVHPDRYGSTKTQGEDLYFVLHTSEGGETTSSAEALCGYMGQPGDRPNSSGGVYGSSYHIVADTDVLRPAVPYDIVAYSAGGGNARGRHLCFPGKAGQTREQWLDENSRAMIRQAAAWLADQGCGTAFPARRLTVDEVKSGVKGVCDHYDITRAFKKSTHTDLGAGFPWDVLFADVQAILGQTPPPLPPPSQKDQIMFIAAPGPEISGRTDVHFAVYESGIVRHASGPDVTGSPIRFIHGVEHFNIYARAANKMSGANISLL